MGNSDQPAVRVFELVMATLHTSQFKSIVGQFAYYVMAFQLYTLISINASVDVRL